MYVIGTELANCLKKMIYLLSVLGIVVSNRTYITIIYYIKMKKSLSVCLFVMPFTQLS